MTSFKFPDHEIRCYWQGPFVIVEARKKAPHRSGLEYAWIKVAKLSRIPSFAEAQRAIPNIEWPDDYRPSPRE